MAKNSIETAIANVANNKLGGKYNLAQYKEGGTRYEEKKKAVLHKQVCEEIMAFVKEHETIPMYFVLSVGISKGAYKMSEFEKGYKAFKADEVEMVAKMGKAYYEYNGQGSRKMSDVAIRLIMKYYENVSHDYDTFMADLKKSKVLGKNLGSREMDYKTLCTNLGIKVNGMEDKVKELAKVA
jgi:hypothetical protein